MKTASTALINYLNAARAAVDAPFAFVDGFLITMAQTGTVLAYSSSDFAFTWNGYLWSASGPLFQGLKYKCSVGLEVDKQQITIAARPTDLVGGAQFLAALADGAFDGAVIEHYLVFFNSAGGSIVDGLLLFHGRVSTVDSVGRTSAQVTVASDLIVLDYDMPRNIWQPSCLHTLYDAGCTLNKASFATTGTVGAASTASLINFGGALAGHVQGTILFTSGANSNLRTTVKLSTAGVSLSLIYPLPNVPAPGDSFTVYLGCDHTRGTCKSRFNNLANYRGYDFVPPPEIAF